MSQGGWIGTWRPHRPRGPIMAQYTSPGPKYCIQGATGYVSHIPTKRKAPAYSMYGAKPPSSKDNVPGPYFVQGTVTNRGIKTGPSYSLSGRTETKVETTPGPACYSPDKAKKVIYKASPMHSMGYRTHGGKVDSTPGPNNYMIPEVIGPHSVATVGSPSYSMTGKNKLGRFDEDLHKTPGPAAYHKPSVEIYKKSAPKYTMAGRLKDQKTDKMPGPAEYELGKISCVPVCSFGIRHSDYTTPVIVDVY
ncbi:outer dense fiber protein 3 [Thamnophis elegans]|uniref:outer dense fiber protein 3 n=1 Tax=Thamnophis elegans TaxID=35005 RepID=UPI001378B73F|nr:outer dense fiber protein 3 [Thamnophis elegans]XP_032065424.1 outer dense fiber protein 3 [Thamnophis elegans]